MIDALCDMIFDVMFGHVVWLAARQIDIVRQLFSAATIYEAPINQYSFKHDTYASNVERAAAGLHS